MMDANDKAHSARRGNLRVAVSVALLGVMLSGCSSVPDAVNPAKWYEKTTDFFSGDPQAAGATPAPGAAGNQGLAADPQAPAPAPAAPEAFRLIDTAPSGLKADQVSGDYASPPITRQSAPSDVLRPAPAVAAAPPPPLAQPTSPVMAAPVAPALMAPSTMVQASPTMNMPSAPPSAPLVMPAMPKRPTVMSMAGAPPPPVFNAPANAMTPFGGEEFETVVISSGGMDTVPNQPRPQLRAAAPQQQYVSGGATSAALFPEPGTTTSGQMGGVAPAGTMRVATIHFANNSSLLDARDQSILGAVVQLQRERGGHVVIVGHASARTRDMDYITHQMVNFQISMERAATIGNALKSLGLAGESLEVQAVSDASPLYMEVMPSGEAGNRRVEIYLAI